MSATTITKPKGSNPDAIASDLKANAAQILGNRADAWLAAPNTLFAGRTPNELIQSGDFEPVRGALLALRYGSFS